MKTPTRTGLMGAGALAATVLLWSSFALSAKGIGASSLATVDVALIRFLTPAVLLIPWIPRTVRALRRERPGILPLLLIGELPHFLLFTALQGVGTGLLSTLCYAYAVRALGGNIAAATGAVSPVLTAVVAVPLFGELMTPALATALALIVVGVITFNLTPTRTQRNGENGRPRRSGAAPGTPDSAQERDGELARAG